MHVINKYTNLDIYIHKQEYNNSKAEYKNKSFYDAVIYLVQ